jgi:menaquinol-cytochrome c reductase iron-sulfur subunit
MNDTQGPPPPGGNLISRMILKVAFIGAIVAAPFLLIARWVNTAPAGREQERERELAARRRKFLALVSVALGFIGAALIAVPVLGFLLAPLFQKIERRWRGVGTVASFQKGQTVEVRFEDASPVAWAGVTGQTAAWLRCEPDGRFIAFAVNCTHLGCPVRWLESAELFMCPCHGGVYYKDGTVAAGPPPQPLIQYPVRVQNGTVEILTGPTPIT